MLRDFIASFEKPKTGRGNVNIDQVEATKAYMRQHPEGITAKDIADFVGCSQVRAGRLLDYLSEATEANSFLVYSDEETYPPIYYIYQDKE